MAWRADSDWIVRVKIKRAPDAVRRYARILRVLRNADERIKQDVSKDMPQASRSRC